MAKRLLPAAAIDENATLHGKVQEGLHLTGYSFARVCSHLEILLSDDRWKFGGLFTDVNDFLANVQLDKDLRPAAEARKRLGKLIKDLQPQASSRQIAKVLNVSKDTIRNDAGEKSPRGSKKLSENKGGKSDAGEKSPPAVSGAAAASLVMKRQASDQKLTELKEARKDFEERRDKGAGILHLEAMIADGKKFPVIYADPPWEFKVYSGKGKQRSAERHYDTMALEAIKALPVEKLAADDCALFIWGVWPEMPGLLDVIKSWGFTFKTLGFVWVKTVSEENSNLFTGMGYWTRANSEPCFFATRGAPQRDAKDVHQVVLAPVGEHSVKPAEVRRRIERLIIGPYLELFGRREVSGWTVWGNEIEAEKKEAAE